VKGRDGVFIVRLDGEVVFDKYDVGRFPAPGEVEGVLATRLGPPAA